MPKSPTSRKTQLTQAVAIQSLVFEQVQNLHSALTEEKTHVPWVNKHGETEDCAARRAKLASGLLAAVRSWCMVTESIRCLSMQPLPGTLQPSREKKSIKRGWVVQMPALSDAREVPRGIEPAPALGMTSLPVELADVVERAETLNRQDLHRQP